MSKPGEIVGGRKETEASKSKQTVIELYDVPDSDSLQTKKRPQSPDDQKYVCRLLAKHGTDYTAMFRDMKVNKMQHTEQQLRKMASRFLLLDEEQRVVDIPQCIKEATTKEEQ